MNIKKSIPVIRKAVQLAGAVLVGAGLFSDLPLSATVIVALTFLMGPVFCGWLCPYGLLQELASLLGRKLGIRKVQLPRSLHAAAILLRYVLLALVTLVSAGFVFQLFSLDPRANWTQFLTGNALTVPTWIVIALFTLLALFVERPFCSYLCAEGAKYGLFGALRPLSVTRDASLCVGCRKCDRACPMNITVSTCSQVRSLQCVDCMSCIAACPEKDALVIAPAGNGRIPQKVILPLLMAGAVAGCIWTVANNHAFALPFGDKIRTAVTEALGLEDSGTASAASSSSGATLTGSAAAAAGDAAGIADGTYEGSGTGFRGETTVSVTVKDETITRIEIVSTNDDQQWFERAWSSVTDEILSSQNTDVDSVSGATYSSVGIKSAVADALKSAGGTNVDSITDDTANSPGKGGHGGPGGPGGRGRR